MTQENRPGKGSSAWGRSSWGKPGEARQGSETPQTQPSFRSEFRSAIRNQMAGLGNYFGNEVGGGIANFAARSWHDWVNKGQSSTGASEPHPEQTPTPSRRSSGVVSRLVTLAKVLSQLEVSGSQNTQKKSEVEITFLKDKKG